MQTITQRQLETLEPTSPSTLVELLRERARQRSFEPLYTFLSDGETEEVILTYGELEERARAIGRRLQFIGAESERVLLLFPPGLDYIAAFFGCLYVGAIAVPAYPPRLNKKLDRLLAIIADAQVSVILTTSSVRQKAQPLFAESDQLKGVRWLAVDEIDVDLAFDWEEPEIGADSIAFIQYTSGSTAIPKGVMVTHGNLLHNEAMIKDVFRQNEQSIIVGWLPLYHDMGLIGNVLQPLYLGARCILMSPVAFLQRPFRWLSAISRYRATTSGGPNFAYELCLRKISPEQRASLDLSSWEVAFNGAEPIRAATQESFAETFAACGFRPEAFQPCYGLAEATLLVTGKHRSELAAVKGFEQRALEQNLLREVTPEDKQARVLVSNGATLSEQQVRIVNPETLTECAPDEVGEVWVSGSSVTRGYWNRPEETRQTFGAYLADTGEGPFLRTGDMGFLRDAELFITGRLKDLVIIRGLNHYPQDIELTAEGSCAVLRPGCGVAFSVEIEGEEQLVIVYEIERHAELDIAEAAATVREAVAEEHEVQVYAVSLIETGTIPKTSSGKLQRRACRARFLAGSLEVVAEWRGATPNVILAAKRETPQIESSPSVPQTVDDIAAWLTSHLAARAGVALSEVDVNQSFARYGVDSLAAIEMAHEVETRLGICVSVVSFLESTSILQFASALHKKSGSRSSLCNLSDLCVSVVDDIRVTTHHRDTEDTEVAQRNPVAIKDYALSYGQRSLWFLHNMEPSSAAYNLASAVRIRSGLDVRALRAALQSLMARHASLRTTFTSQLGEPIQRVNDFMEVCFTEEDAAGWDEGVLNERLVEAANRPFDLEHGPLLRVSLFKKSETESILLLAVHHIVTDFWSLAILVQELGVLYRLETGQREHEQSALPIVGQPYTEYARWQLSMLEGPEGERLWSYWKERLSGELPALNLPTDHSRPAAQTYNGASVPFKLNAELTKALQELSRANDATLYMTLLAAFQVLLSRYTGQTNFAVGSPTAGRRAAGWASTIGYFVNPVVMRAELSGDPTFVDYLKRVRQETLAALAHLDFPFSLLVERLQPERDWSRSPLFQTMFVLQKSYQASDARFAELASGESGAKLEVGGLSLESIAIPKRVAQFDLTLMMAEAEGELAASFIYNTDLFEAATISRLAGHFRTLLEGIIRNPEKRVTKLPLLTGNERRQLLIEWNKTAPLDWGMDQPAIAADLLHEGVEAQVARTPHGIALIAGEERLTYAELEARSNQLAHHLLSLGVTTESRVGLLTDRNTEMVIAILAVLKAGAAYVPLDPQYPHERIAFMLADSGAKVLLTQAHLAERLTEHQAHTVLLDAERLLISRQPTHSPSVPMEKVNLAYVIYTSGSTGRPKGVAISHQSATALLQWAHRTFRVKDLAGVLASTSICFDLSIFELFVPLSCGGTVILADNALHLPLLPARAQVTLINTVPSAMAELVRSNALPSSVRVVNLAGEPLTTRLASEVYAAARVEEVWNLYGPTEDTTYSTAVLVEAEQERITIGRPITGTQAYVLDQSLQPVPVSVCGELYLGGAGLARGYLARPELTAERFIPDPFSAASGARLYRTGDLARYQANGEIEYLGRIDHQVKVRGFRIELGEVEAVLRQQEQVQEAVVVARGDRLVAYVVEKNTARRSSDQKQDHGSGYLLLAPELWAWLGERLPHYMVPSAIVVLPEMPLTPNGKTDRKRLPDLKDAGSAEQGQLIEPRTQMEERVRGIWQEVLKQRELSVAANFFSVGGHSLLATQVLSRVNQMFQVEISLRAFFERPTIAALAAMLEENGARPQLDRASTLTIKSRKERRLDLLRTKVEQLPEHEVKRILAEKKLLSRERNDV